MSTWLFIDPGTTKLGMARFVEDGHSVWLKDSRVIRVKRVRGVNWKKRVDQMVREVMLSMQTKRDRDRYAAVECVVIEEPRHYGGGGSGKGAAARNSGSILKLMFFIGALRQMLLERGYRVVLVKVETWKGNTPKHITARRVEKWWGRECSVREKTEGSDEADACGIGDYWFRKRKLSGEERKVVKRVVN